jgi:hypothetical protein
MESEDHSSSIKNLTTEVAEQTNWNDGMMESENHWNIGMLEYWKPATTVY